MPTATTSLVLDSSGSMAVAEGSKEPPELPVLLVHGLKAHGNQESDWIKGHWVWKDRTAKPEEKDFTKKFKAKFENIGGSGTEWAVYKEVQSPGGVFDSAKVYMLDYSGYHNAEGHLKPTAGILSRAIDLVEKDAGVSDVYVVGHSMGGLLTRAVMKGLAVDPKFYDSQDFEQPRDDIYGFTTIDTPHQGHVWAGVRGFAVHAEGDLDSTSDFMKALNTVPSIMDEDPYCSVVVGEAVGWPIKGDGLLPAPEQIPIVGTVPSATVIKSFPVLHGWGLIGPSKQDYKDYKTAQESKPVRDWTVEKYREAAAAYKTEHSGIKIDAAKGAARTVCSILEGAAWFGAGSVGVGLVSFNEDAHSIEEPTSDYSKVRDAISGLQADGSTNLVRAIEAGAAQLEGATGSRTLILLSDGMDEEDNTPDQIRSAAQMVRDSGIDIYTIGFGTPGTDIDEDLLKDIAGSASRYSYADPSSLIALAGSFIFSQVAATQPVLGNFEGAVAQGATSEAGVFDVPTKNGVLQAILYWPGSVLEMQLKDPAGAVVASGYPGLKVVRDTVPAQLFVENAKPGTWTMSVFGKETSMEQEPYYALTSFQETSATPTVSGGGGSAYGGGPEILMFVIALGVVGSIGVLVLGRNRSTEESSAASSPLDSADLDRFALRVGPAVFPLKRGVLSVGRASDNDLVLEDPEVSRHHAVLVVSENRVTVKDNSSAGGVRLNGAAVTEADVFEGDIVEFGSTSTVLEYMRGSSGLLS